MLHYLQHTSWTPTEPFYAIKVNGEYHPCTYQSDTKKGTYESFIRGTGWKKQKKGYLIPLFEGSMKDFQVYIDLYGEYCLFYSITGKQLGDDACIIWSARQGFKVILSVGWEHVLNFYTQACAINAKIKELELSKRGIDITQNYWIDDKRWINTRDLFFVAPTYSIMAYFLTAPHVDVIQDDERLWKHFVSVCGPETEEERAAFPVCMRDRFVYLWSEEVASMYETMMNDFPMILNKAA